MKNVGAILVVATASCRVNRVIGIAGDMIPPVDYRYSSPTKYSDLPGNNTPREARTYYQYMHHFFICLVRKIRG
jgi:hypothetical protein